MMRLSWDSLGYESGLDRGVLYSDGAGVPWNGLQSVEEQASGSLVTSQYVDGVRRVVVEESGDFEATISAYTYPDELEDFDRLKRFGLSYRTMTENGYKLFIVYNALLQPTDKRWTTTSETLDASTFSWDLTATTVPLTTARPAAQLILESDGYLGLIGEVEDMLYGTETTDPRLPDPNELIELFESHATLRIRDNGDGTWTAIGPDSMVQVNPDGTFQINAPTAFPVSEGAFIVNSY